MELRGKTVLVTGSEGFIGSHLVERLLREGCRVRAFVLYNSFNAAGWLDTLPADLRGAIELHHGDVRDAASVRTAVRGADVVFHLAALIAIPYSYEAPESYLDTNVRGTLNVLQACRELSTARLLVTSTSEVYGTARVVPIDEAHPKQAQSPYAASKSAADAMAESFHKSFDLPVVIVRPFNTYGPRQSARAVLPTIVSQLLGGANEIQLGALSPTRDLNFVTDICEGFLALARCDQAIGQAVNIGSGTEVSVGQLAERLIASVNPRARVVEDPRRVRPAGSEVERLVCDSSLLRRLTGWAPQVTLDEGIRAVVDWMRRPENLARYKPHEYNR